MASKTIKMVLHHPRELQPIAIHFVLGKVGNISLIYCRVITDRLQIKRNVPLWNIPLSDAMLYPPTI